MKLSNNLILITNDINDKLSNDMSLNGIFTRIRNDKELISDIENVTHFLNQVYFDITIGQRLYHIINNLELVEKCICGNPKKFYRFSDGYFNTCGNPECKRKVKADSFKNTIKSKYGDSYFKKGSEERKKYEATMLTKYGVDHNFKSNEVKEKIRETLNEKYGVDSPLKNKEISEKRLRTCIEKYGTLDFINSESSRNTNILKYGHENTMKNPEIAKKVSESSSITKQKTLSSKLDSYSIGLVSYSTTKVDLNCERCNHDFSFHSTTINAKLRNGIDPCPYCNPIDMKSSVLERDLLKYIEEIYSGEVLSNDRSLFKNNKQFSEVDIYLPKINVAFEFNGLYWHSEIYKNSKYHQEKTEFLSSKGISLYHIWEDDWRYKKEIVKSMISSALGAVSRKIFARKCEIKQVTKSEYKHFTQKNHLKGYCPASIIIGLYYDNELVSLMSLAKTRKLIDSKKSKYEYEVIRSCSLINTTVVGGVSRIVKYIKDNITKSIVTYCDVSFSPNPKETSYYKSGFIYIGKTTPGYYWVVDDRKSNRLNWTKSKLISLGFDSNLKADDIMHSMGYYKIWDCGNYKYGIH